MNLGKLFLAIGMLSLVMGCSKRGWYEGLQQSNEFNCYQRPMSQQLDCLEEARAVSYDDYQRELDKLRGPTHGN